MSLEHSPARQQRRKSLTRLRDRPWRRLGISRTKFYEDFIATGRVHLIAVGERARAVDDDEIDSIAQELIAAPCPRAAVPVLTDEQEEKRRQAQAAARAQKQKRINDSRSQNKQPSEPPLHKK